MSDIEKMVWTAFGGLSVYVAGQLVSKFFLDPLDALRKSVGEVRFHLAFHAPTIRSPTERSKERSDAATEALLKNSCDLIAKLHAVPLYEVTRLLAFGALPARDAVENAAVLLRGLSTHMHEEGEKANASLEIIHKRIAKIEHLLCLKPWKKSRAPYIYNNYSKTDCDHVRCFNKLDI